MLGSKFGMGVPLAWFGYDNSSQHVHNV